MAPAPVTSKKSRQSQSSTRQSESLSEKQTSQAYAVSAFATTEAGGASYFAVASQALNASRLVVFNSSTGAHVADFTTPTGSACLAIAFGKQKDQIYVALCLTTGAVLIYSVSTGALQYTLSNGHRGPVTAFAFSPDVRRGYSVGEDGLLVEWELKKARMLRTLQSKVKNLTRVAVDHKGQYIAIASNQIDLINIESFKVEKSLSGHATAVVQLEFDASSEYLFSAAADDRFISQWPLASANALPKVYSVETSTKFIALSAAGYLMAVMTNGEVNLWDTNAEHSDASATTAATDATPGKKKKAIARPADCKIVLTHPDNSSTNVPVFNAMFHLDRLLVVYGSALRPLFDRLAFKTDVGKLVPNVSVARHPDPPLSATDNKGSYCAQDMTSPLMRPASDKVVIPFDLTDEITLQERVQALNTGSSDAATGKQDDDGTGAGESSAKAGGASNNKRGKSQKKTATPISLHQMLSQAIQAGDAQMLDKALDVVDKTIVSATVQRMSPVQVITLLELLVVRLQKSPGRASLLIEWIRAVLITHSAYLLSVPNLSSRLGLLYRTLDARQQTLSKLTRLYGRLDLAVSQIERKRLAPAPDEDDAVVVYDDNDDDEGVDEDDGVDDEAFEDDDDDDDLDLDLDDDDNDDNDDNDDDEEEEFGSEAVGDDEGDDEDNDDERDVAMDDHDDDEDDE